MPLVDYLPPIPPPPRPDIQPLPRTRPLTPLVALSPPLLYYLAAFLLPPFASTSESRYTPLSILTGAVRNALALAAAVLFFRLPIDYYVPASVGLTYQLALVGLYGGCRVVDAFFISYYYCNHIPRRVEHRDHPRDEQEEPHPSSPIPHNDSHDNIFSSLTKAISRPEAPTAVVARSPTAFTLHRVLSPSQGVPVTEHATTTGYPQTFLDRASYALELILSMRGAGFTWNSADVRHTKRTWRPSPQDRIHSILVHVLPTLIGCWAIIRGIYTSSLNPESVNHIPLPSLPSSTFISTSSSEASALRFALTSRQNFNSLPLVYQLTLTGALGTFLLAAFSFGHSISAILLSPLRPHPISFFPPLYTTRVWHITSVRTFWSYGWHRLFSRLFLVYGVWPGEWIAGRALDVCYTINSSRNTKANTATATGPRDKHTATKAKLGRNDSIDTAVLDTGKVLGAFASSALVHALAGHAVLGGRKWAGEGEFVFFMENGLAVVFEEAVIRAVKTLRRQQYHHQKKQDGLKSNKTGGNATRGVNADEYDQHKREEKENEEHNGDPNDLGDSEIESRWYDAIIGRIWWMSVLAFTGRNFARGWTEAGLVREMAFL